VEDGGPAYEAGLRAGDIISHINGTAVQGLLHIQVVSLILSGGRVVRVQATPLSGTTIKVGHRPRMSSFGRVSGSSRIPRIGRRHRPSMSLFRRLSNRKAEQLSASSQLGVPQSSCPGTTQTYIRSLSTGADVQSAGVQQTTTPTLSSDSDSSQGNSEPNSPRSRPSSLHGLKNKAMLVKSASRTTSSVTSLRRQSFHAVPPSPLAAAVLPSPLTRTLPVTCTAAMSTSPTVTRSLSPLVGGQCLLAAGISNLSQSYSPACHSALFRNSLSAVETSLSASRRRSASPESLKVNQGRVT